MIARPVIPALGLLLLLACGDGDGSDITTQEYRALRDQPTACGADRPPAATAMQFDEPDDLGLTERVTAVLHTSCGDISIELLPGMAPVTVNSFVFLAEHGFFDGTASHRMIRGSFIQAGDPTASGFGGPGYRLPDELPPEDFTYSAGVVAMANGGPGTGGSQFFIVLGELGLPPAYSVFGRVTGNTGALDAMLFLDIGTNPTTLESSLPLETVCIESITIER